MKTECSERGYGYEDGRQVALTNECMCGGSTDNVPASEVADCSFFAMASLEEPGNPMRTLTGHQDYVTGFLDGLMAGRQSRRVTHHR